MLQLSRVMVTEYLYSDEHHIYVFIVSKTSPLSTSTCVHDHIDKHFLWTTFSNPTTHQGNGDHMSLYLQSNNTTVISQIKYFRHTQTKDKNEIQKVKQKVEEKT